MIKCSPDPIITANIYASGLLDEVVVHALLPFWRTVGRSSLREHCSMWIIRYSRRGEHLKIRLHGRTDDQEALQDTLQKHVGGWLDGLGDTPPPSSRVSRFDVRPIDLEDEGSEMAPDRTFLWTTYRRNSVSLGGSPWLEDDEFVRCATACFASGCELMLTASEGEAAGRASDPRKILIKALVRAIGALGLDQARATEYLEYHRDWLLRFFLSDEEQVRTVRTRFEQQIRNSHALVDQIHRILDGRLSARRTDWEQTLSRLGEYTRSFQGNEEYQVDPFTVNVSFPPIFKVLHGLANQIGVSPLDEASTHNLLVAAAAATTA